MPRARILGALLLAALLASCGGGGSGDGPPAAPTPPAPALFGIDTRPAFTGSAIPTTDASDVDTGFTIDRAFPNLTFEPLIYATGVPGEARLVAVAQSGKVYAFASDDATATRRVVLDLAAAGSPTAGVFTSGGETGLLGLAFDPGFRSNRTVYVQYTATSPLRTVIARFTWDRASDLVDPASELRLLEIPQPFGNHKAGMIEFGPDGQLYIAQGDGGSGNDPGNRAQDRGSLLGKMLRITPPPAGARTAYTVPADNPFVNEAGTRPEIWAIGLRNPFRFSFDRETGLLWAGDVGQGALEEIDILRRGLNYGWRVFEGTRLNMPGDPRNPPYEPPVHEYGRSLGAAVIGGYVYRGTRLPALYGRYLYGDFASGRVWALAWDGTRVTANAELGRLSSLSSFGEDSDGELLLATLGGTLHRLTDSRGGSAAAPPTQLSRTGLFTSLASLTPATGLVEYDVRHPFWSDGTRKRRWFAIPDGTRIGFSAGGAWQFPVGSVLVKHFEIDTTAGTRRLETRVLARRASGWYGLVYRWRTDGSDADLLTDGAREMLTVATAGGNTTFEYEYPSRTDCLRCHTPAAGDILGARTAQLNRNFTYTVSRVTDNQLRTLDHLGVLDRDIGPFTGGIAVASQHAARPALDDAGASIERRARAYLETNCAVCHQPGGGTPVTIDLREDVAVAAMGIVDVAPTAGDLGIANARIVARGDRARSVLWQRMRRLDEARMPVISSHRVDDAGVDIVGRWIDAL